MSSNRTTGAPHDTIPVVERWVLIIAGLALVVGGLVLWVWPVQHTKPAPDTAKCDAVERCFIKVDDAPEVLLTSLVVLGALLALVGVNNRPITSFKGPAGTGFETLAPVAEDMAKTETAQKAVTKGKTGKPVETATQIAALDARVRTHELERLNGRPLSLSEVKDVAKQASMVGLESLDE